MYFIDKETLNVISDINFYTKEANESRLKIMSGEKEELSNYESWINSILVNLPFVFSYQNLNNKNLASNLIKIYRNNTVLLEIFK